MFFAFVVINEPANRKRIYERKFKSSHQTHIRQIFGNTPDIQVVAVSSNIRPRSVLVGGWVLFPDEVYFFIF